MKMLRVWTLWCLAGLPALCMAQEPDPTQVAAGRLIYEQGMLPDGRSLQATRPEGFRIEGQAAACTACHRRSGMGTVEGNLKETILVPPVAARVLLAPARFANAFLDASHYYVPNDAWARALTRPAYDEVSFARALRDGIDSAGKALQAPMMRYELDAASIQALLAYLRTLMPDADPGVDADALHLATVITSDVPDDVADSMLDVVRAWSNTNRTGGRDWRLHVWRLAGTPSTWNAQLAQLYQQRPVFALLSGAGMEQWQPVHEFCEHHGVPCILPSVEALQVTKNGYYSLYYSAGVLLEARILEQELVAENTVQALGTVTQISADSTGTHAAHSLHQALQNRGRRSIVKPFHWTAPAAVFRDTGPEDSIVLWLRPAELDALVAYYPAGPPVRRVYLSALLAAPGSVAMPPAWRSHSAWVSLFDDLSVQGEIARARLAQWLQRQGIARQADMRRQADAYASCYLLKAALMEMQTQEHRRPAVPLNRDQLLETLEMLLNKYSDGTDLVDPDSHVAYYGHMSLGPTQRVAVRGGGIMRYQAGSVTKLEIIGGRIVP